MFLTIEETVAFTETTLNSLENDVIFLSGFLVKFLKRKVPVPVKNLHTFTLFFLISRHLNKVEEKTVGKSIFQPL